MDKESIVQLLRSIKETGSVGPKPGNFNPGERVHFALDHGLIKRLTYGNFSLTDKGEDLLSGQNSWENILA